MLLRILATVGPLLGARTAAAFPPAPPVAFTSDFGGPLGTLLAQGHPFGYCQSSAAVASSYVCHAGGSAAFS